MKQTFNIQATAAAFDTLSSRLYSNPVLAVIRELSTNANDAHIEAGVEKPFDLHLPVANEPYFYIRDYGNGIPEELIYNIYTTFFMSTKTEDENQTGYFGLGSKSPYALVENYTVTSFCDGKKKTYEMAKGSNGPTVEKIKEEDSNETGLEIKFNVYYERNYEYDRWVTEAKDFFKGTSFLPNINFDYNEMDVEEFAAERTFFADNSIKIGNGYRAKAYANVAGVMFPISINEIAGYSEELETMFTKGAIEKISIMVGKSDVTITPSRESLHYDSKTIEFLYNKLTNVVNEYYDNIEKNFDKLDYTTSTDLCNTQCLKPSLNYMIKNKISNIFFEKAISCRYSGRGAHIDIQSPTTKPSAFSWGGCKKVYLVDFSGIKTTVKQNVVNNFLSGQTFDDNGKLTSTAFANVVKSIGGNKNCSLLFAAQQNEEALKKCKEYAPDAEVIKWADYCEAKKEEGNKRKVGFKTRATLVKQKNSGFKNFCGSNPDLEDGEIGLIIAENKTDDIFSLCWILDEFMPDYKIAVRPCKDTVYPNLKKKGFQDIHDFVGIICRDHSDVIKTNMQAEEKQCFVKQHTTYSFEEEFYDALNDPQYDELENIPSFKILRELYTKENFELEYNSKLTKMYFANVDMGLHNYEEDFCNDIIFFPLIRKRVWDNEVIRDFLEYMIIYYKSGKYDEKKSAANKVEEKQEEIA